VGESSSQVRAAYAGAWGEVIRDEDRPTVRAISLQRWAGQAWAGTWEHQTYLAVPATRGGKASASEVSEVAAEADADVEALSTDTETDLVDAETDLAGAEIEATADLDDDAETIVEVDAKADTDPV